MANSFFMALVIVIILVLPVKKTPLQIILALFIPCASLLWYHHFGAYQKLAHSANDWYLQGKQYLQRGDYPQSIHQLEKALTLEPSNLDYKVALAQALFFYQDKKLSTRAEHLLTDVLAEQPDNADALNLLAVNDYLAGRFQQAIKRWKLLLLTYPEDSVDGKALRLMIAKAKEESA